MKVKAYHYSYRDSLKSILTHGIMPGRDADAGERLPFVLMSMDQYDNPGPGQRIHIEFEVDNEDPRFRMVNDVWAEFCGTIPPTDILRVQMPPRSNHEVVQLLKANGMSIEALDPYFEYQPVEVIRERLKNE